MKAVQTDRGLLIPNQELDRFGTAVVDEGPFRLVIPHEIMTDATRGIVGREDGDAVDRLIEAIEVGEV